MQQNWKEKIGRDYSTQRHVRTDFDHRCGWFVRLSETVTLSFAQFHLCAFVYNGVKSPNLSLREAPQQPTID